MVIYTESYKGHVIIKESHAAIVKVSNGGFNYESFSYSTKGISDNFKYLSEIKLAIDNVEGK